MAATGPVFLPNPNEGRCAFPIHWDEEILCYCDIPAVTQVAGLSVCDEHLTELLELRLGRVPES